MKNSISTSSSVGWASLRFQAWRPLLMIALVAVGTLTLGRTASAVAGVQILGTSSSGEENSGSSPSKTISFTVPAGNNRLLVVTSSGAGNNTDIQSVTWNGGNMTQAAKLPEGGGHNSNAGIWYVVLGTSASPVTANVTVTYGGNFFFEMTATAFSNVDQANPVSGAVTGTSASIAVSSASTSMVIDAIAGDGTTGAPSGGQTTVGVAQDLVFGGQSGGASTAAGASSVTMNWSGISGDLVHAAVSINAPTPLSATQNIASKTLTAGQPSVNFTPVTGLGGSGGFSYSISPPLGNNLAISSSTGAITGVPSGTLPATTYTVTVKDSSNATAGNTFSLTVNGPVAATQAIASKTLTASQPSANFTPITGSGGTGTLTYGISPTLGNSLSFSTTTGAITGVPSGTLSATTYTVTATDTNGATGSNTFSLTVNSAVTATQAIATKTVVSGSPITAFTPITGAGGTGTLTYTINPPLPSILAINSGNGSITGTPSAPQTATTYTVTVTDTNSATASNTFQLTVNPPQPTVFSVSPNSGPSGGANNVNINGTDFIIGATTVKFGANAAGNVNVLNPNSLSATAPAGVGTVDVTVTTAGGTSGNSAADQYTYTTLTPSVTNATTNEDTQTTSGLVITANAADGGTTADYKITAITNGTLFLSDGTTQITNGSFITKTQGSAGLKFTPSANFFGTGSFQVQGSTSNSDPGLNGGVVTATITVNAVADTPSVTNATTNEDVQTTSGLVISRNAADGAEVTNFKITGITNGTLFQNNGTTAITNGSFITFAQGNAGLKFTPSANFFGTGTFQVQASTSGSDPGLGGGVVTATITVNAVADTPSVTNATTNEDTQTTSGLVISRNAADGAEVTSFKITGITNGNLFLSDGTTAVTSGSFITVAQGNAGLKFTPSANFFGSGSFGVQASTSSSDAGLGGSVVTATITVNPVADTPSVTNATTNEDVQTTSGLVISRNAADGAEVTNFKITGITNGSLFLSDGTTPVASGSFVTFAQGNAGLKFTPPANFFGTGSFQVQASTSSSDSGLGGGVVTATITVNAVADTPSVTNATTNEDTQTTSGLVISRNAADGAEVTNFKITSITNGSLFLNDGTTAVTGGSFITVAQGNAGLKFTPSANFFGSGSFGVQASLSNSDSGLGGGVVTATITVNPVADTPSITGATTTQDTQTSGGLVVSRNAADGAEVTNFKITGITNGTLFLNDGATPVTAGSFITFAQGNAGLKFTPAAGFRGNASVTVMASTSASDAGLGGSAATATVTVNEAVSFIVTTTADTVDPFDGLTSLREAIQNANTLGGNPTITFDPGVTGVITLTAGALQCTQSMTIQGPSAGLVVNGNNADRIFFVSGSLSMSISGLTLTGGHAIGSDNSGGGGAIFNLSTSSLTLNSCTIAGNTADTFGGGILNFGSLALLNSTVSGNTANGPATGGGGIDNAGPLTMVNSTLLGNSAPNATEGGGGLENLHPALIVNSTITGNLAAHVAGGISSGNFTATLWNTIVAANQNNTTVPDVGGESGFTSQGNNLIGNVGTATGFTNGVNGDQVGTGVSPINPLLSPLQNNGGPTQTAALLDGSPAINAGANLSSTQHVAVSGMFGTFTLTFNGQTTSFLAFNATPSAVQTALGSLSTIGVGNVGVTGTNGDYIVIFKGTLASTSSLLTGSGSGMTSVQVVLVSPQPYDQRGTGFPRIQGTTVDIGAVEALLYTPTVTNATTNEDIQSTSGLVITANTADGGGTVGYQITSITNGTLYQNDGSTAITSGSFITAAQGSAGLKFTGSANFFGTGSFSVQTTTTGDASGLVGSVVSASITVNPVADTPSVTSTSTVENTQTTSGLVISRNAVDGTEVTSFKITNIQNGTLFQNNGTTQITSGSFITFAQGNAGLKFTPANNFLGIAHFDVQGSIDNEGTGISPVATANITVGTLNPTPTQVGTTGTLNRQNSLFQLTVNVTNTTPFNINGFRLHVNYSAYLAAYPTLRLYNASSAPGASDVYVDYPFPVATNATVPVTLEFYTANRLFPNPFSPTLTVESIASENPVTNESGTPITKITRLADHTILLEWNSIATHWYRVSYSSDMVNWYDCPTPIQAGSNKMQWNDTGAPFTSISPADPSVTSRFYIVNEIPTPQ